MTLDDSAVNKLKAILAEETDPNTKLRVFVQGGGCSGFQYGFTLDQEKTDEDFDFVYDTVTVLVDSMSWQYLQGARIRWDESEMGSSFVIDNPQAVSTCGCGSSFSV